MEASIKNYINTTGENTGEWLSTAKCHIKKYNLFFTLPAGSIGVDLHGPQEAQQHPLRYLRTYKLCECGEHPLQDCGTEGLELDEK